MVTLLLFPKLYLFAEQEIDGQSASWKFIWLFNHRYKLLCEHVHKVDFPFNNIFVENFIRNYAELKSYISSI